MQTQLQPPDPQLQTGTLRYAFGKKRLPTLHPVHHVPLLSNLASRNPLLSKPFLDPPLFQAEDGIRDYYASRGLGDVYKRQFETRRRRETTRDDERRRQTTTDDDTTQAMQTQLQPPDRQP